MNARLARAVAACSVRNSDLNKSYYSRPSRHRMATIVRGSVPANKFALSHTLASVPDLKFEAERIVDSGGDALMPLLWIRGDRDEGLADVLAEDPSVRAVELLAEFDDEWLYRMEWVDRIDLVFRMLTASEATILDAHGRRDRGLSG